jgi:uncharacterized membrane protein
MTEPAAPHSWASRLKSETERWVSGGLITAEQRDAILGLYPRSEAAGRDRTILILTLLGSLLVGAGVILFFAANWPKLSAGLKLAAVVAAVAAAYGAGYFFQYAPGSFPRLGHSLIFLGSLLYGAGIWLVAQVFHLASHFPAGFLAWGLGVLPLVAATSSVWVLYLAILVLSIWTIMEQTGGPAYNFLYPLIMLAFAAPLSRKVKSALAETGIAMGLLAWFLASVMTRLSGLSPRWEITIVARIFLLYGAQLFAIGVARLGEPRAYTALGGLLSLAGAYMLTFRQPYGSADAMPSLLSGPAVLIAGLSIVLAITLGSAFLAGRKNRPTGLRLEAFAAVPVVAGLFAHTLPETPRMISFNLLLFAGTVGWIILGIRMRSQMVVNLGLGVFMVHMLTRYFDLFFSAMNRSLFFILGGLLLLGGGWFLERNRRRWTQGWGGEDVEA